MGMSSFVFSAAIASLQAGVFYGLDILAADIEDNPGNMTRFAVTEGDGVIAHTQQQFVMRSNFCFLQWLNELTMDLEASVNQHCMAKMFEFLDKNLAVSGNVSKPK